MDHRPEQVLLPLTDQNAVSPEIHGALNWPVGVLGGAPAKAGRRKWVRRKMKAIDQQVPPLGELDLRAAESWRRAGDLAAQA